MRTVTAALPLTDVPVLTPRKVLCVCDIPLTRVVCLRHPANLAIHTGMRTGVGHDFRHLVLQSSSPSLPRRSIES